MIVLDRINGWRAGLPDRVREPLDEMLRRRGYLLVDELPNYFGPRATPLLALPMWVAEAVGEPDPEVWVDAAEASLTGYFLIRLHDDFCDEGLGDPAAVMLVGSVLQARMHQLFRRVVDGGQGFDDFAPGIFASYADAMLYEREVMRADGVTDRVTFRAILARYDPLLLPVGAVLARNDRWDLMGPLREIVSALAESVQLFNDAFDAEQDLRAGNRTWAVNRYAPEGQVDPLRRRLFVEGALHTLVEEAVVAASRAAELAQEHGLPGAVPHLHARIDAMRQAREGVFEDLWRYLLGADDSP